MFTTGLATFGTGSGSFTFFPVSIASKIGLVTMLFLAVWDNVFFASTTCSYLSFSSVSGSGVLIGSGSGVLTVTGSGVLTGSGFGVLSIILGGSTTFSGSSIFLTGLGD